MKKFELLLALVVIVASCANTIIASEKGDKCSNDLQPCVELWKERTVCAKLGGPLCDSIQSEGNTSEHISGANSDACKDSKVLCPMTRKCQDQNATCDLNTAVSMSTNSTPWGDSCPSDQQFCSISMSCISKNTSCSFKAIYDWYKSGNSQLGPYGTNCTSSEKYCLASMSCVNENATCDVVYNSTLMGSFCPKDSKYCGNRGSCINGANSTCSSYAVLNMTGRADPGNGGWRSVCEARKNMCKRFAAGMAKCWPKISSCVNEQGNQSLSNNNTNINNNNTNNNNNNNTNNNNNNNTNNNNNNNNNQQSSSEKGDKCPSNLQPCVHLWRERDLCAKLSGPLCGAIEAESNASQHISGANSDACKDSKVLCPMTRKCQDQNATCDLNTLVSMSSNSTPWGDSCPSDQQFCSISMSCISKNTSCSFKAIYDWYKSGNSQLGPYGTNCTSSEKYCLASMSCVNKNATCDVVYNSTLMGSFCPKDSKYCGNRGSCINGANSTCSSYAVLNMTGRADPGNGGWKEVCEARKHMCTRFAAGMSKCWPKISSCVDLKDTNTQSCPQGESYCNSTMKCLKNNEICCPKGQKLCKSSNSSCIPDSEKCCQSNETYCKDLSKCIPKGNACNKYGCTKDESYCPDRKKCLKKGSKCPLDDCTETECGKIIQKALQCEYLDKVCPAVISAPETILSILLQEKNLSKPIKCSKDETYCPLYDSCIDSKKSCKLDLKEQMWTDNAPSGAFNCTGGKAYCKVSSSCKDKSSFNCTLERVVDWLKAGNESLTPLGSDCSPQKYCLESNLCTPASSNCTFKPPKAYNVTGNETVFDKMCGSNGKFCSKQYRCINKFQACEDLKVLNYTGVTSDNGTGFLEVCKHRHAFCPVMVRGMMDCATKKQFAHCVKRNVQPCPPSLVLCKKTGKCLKPKEYCLAPGECPPYQFDCPELGGCINKTIKCEVPRSDISYKSAWFFQKLDEVKPTLFSSGSTIAIVSVSESSGKVEYHDGSKWVAASGITEKTALVLGKTNMLRFVPASRVWHGAVLFNYTVMAGTVGQKVDASSSKRNPGDTIVSVIMPNVFTPNLTEVGGPFNIDEDDKSRGFKLEDKMKLDFQNFSTESNIGFDLQAKMDRLSVKAYREYLDLVKTAKAAVAIIFLENSTKKGGFSGPKPSRDKPEISYDLKTMIKIKPGLHYNGPLDATFAAAVLYDPPNGRLSFDMPQMTKQIIFAYMYLNNATENQHAVLQGVMKKFKSSKDRPTKANVMSFISKEETASKGLNKTDLGQITKWVTLAYDRVKLVNGKDEDLPPYKVIEVKTNKGSRQLVYSKDVLKIVVNVLKMNDQPVLTSYIAFFPPIAYNLTTNPNKGFAIKEITERIPYPYGKKPPKLSNIKPLISDVDGNDTFGVGIAFAKNSSIGAYYYRNDSKGSWEIIDLKNVLTNGKLVNRSDVLLLKSNAELKFQMHDPETLWTNVEARKEANLLLVAWDQSDKLSNGIHSFHFPVSKNSSISSRFASAYTARFGCDGKTGSKGKFDLCGVCGGDGEGCKGCDGVRFSGAVINDCGNCTGGTTNRTFDFNKDCGGGCGTSYTDACGVCQKTGEVADFKDCAGVCFGKATKNKCGNCVGGNTTKPLNFGIDLCGVCGGNNKTCLDCAGVPAGKKKIDICGSCLDPSDSSFNARCVKLGSIDVLSGKLTGGTKVAVKGAGLKGRNYKTAKCEFFNSTGSVAVSNAAISGNTFTISTPSVSTPGLYSLRCSFDNSPSKEKSISNFTFFDKSLITISGAAPNEVKAKSGAVNVTISGTGFVDTKFVKCITNKKTSFPATFVSATSVVCHLPDQPKSAALKIAPQFGPQDTALPADAANFTVFVDAPVPSSAKFSNNLQNLILIMDKPAQYKGKEKSCEGLFDADSIATFGSKAKCVFRTPMHLFVLLRGKKPTVAPSSVIAFNKDSLTTKFEDVTKKASGVKNITINGPDKKVKPKARLSGPAQVGTCGEVILSTAGSRGDGGRAFVYSWDVAWSSNQDMGQIQAADTADLNALRSLLVNQTTGPLVKITKNNLKIDKMYEFSVTVKNFLNEVSPKAKVVVVRQNKNLPVVDVGPTTRTIKASRSFTVTAKPKLSPCLDPNAVAAKVLFSWEINAVGVDIGITDKPRLSIKPETLTGGKSYKLTVTAVMASDQTLSSTTAITLTVESSPLQAAIKGGEYQVIGATKTLTLDASPSKDPDGANERTWYTWECTKGGKPCFVPDPVNAGRKKRLVLPTNEVVTLDVGANLETNTVYIFKMTFNKGTRKASATKKIEVLPGSPPEVEIKPQETNKQNPTQVTIIKAKAKSTLTLTNVTWECVSEDGYAFIDLAASGVVLTPTKFSFTKKSGQASASKNYALVIAANQLADGVSYKFRTTVTHADSSARAEVVITTNAAPTVGTLVPDVDNGTAMDTLFTISAAEGWSDDVDDYPLKYQFGYIRENKIYTLGFFGESNQIETKLPPGEAGNNLTLFVVCVDALGATSTIQTVVTVLPKTIDAAFLASSQDDILNSFESADWNSALRNMGSLLQSIDSGSGVAGVTAMKEKFADSTLNILETGGVTDDNEAKYSMYGSMGGITKGGTSMSSAKKLQIKNTIASIESSSSSKRRKRRAVSSPTVTSITVSQAESTLTLLSGLIDGNAYDADTITLKKDFLPVVDIQGQKVCAGLALGMPAAIVKNTLVVLRSEKNAFSNVATTFTDVACNDCPSSLAKTAKVKLGETLQDSYSSWKCQSSNDLCSGACLISSQQIFDLLSTSSMPNITLTEVVDVKLYNPETYAAIAVSTPLAKPVVYHLPVLNVTTNNETYFECKRWTGSAWATTGCTTKHEFVYDATNTTKYVECSCTELGYTAAFKATRPPPTRPTQEPVTTVKVLPTTIIVTKLPTVPVVQVRRVRFSLKGDYDTLVGTPAKKEQFKKDVTKSVAKTLGVNETRIVNMTFTKGSVIVMFALKPAVGDTDASLGSSLTKLENAIKNDNFTVTLSDGTVLKADPTSFSSTKGDTYPTAAPTVAAATEKPGLTETEIIIISCVCGGLALIILVVIVVCCYKKKQTHQMKVSPDNSRTSLRGDVEMSERNKKVDGNYNEAVTA